MAMWYLKQSSEDKCIYIFRNRTRITSTEEGKPLVGCVLNVRLDYLSKEEIFLTFKVQGLHKPRSLKIERFIKDKNSLCEIFANVQKPDEFCEVFKEKVFPYINPETGVFQHPRKSTSATKRPNDSNSSTEKAAKRKRAEVKADCEDMNQRIQEHFIGQFSLPVRCLKEPSPPRLVRPVTAQFVKELKKEMLENPTSDVAPMIGLVFLIDGEQFDQQHPEAYSYEVIGGNNSRKALQELIEEHPHLASEKPYCQWPVSVYSNLTDEQAQHLAIKHNRATHFTHAMTTQDKIALCREKLYLLEGKDLAVDETPEGTTEWRISCASTLMMTRKQLQENMIFFLAGLSKKSYTVLKEIFCRYEENTLGKAPRAKKDALTKRDCKGSNFKGLRNLDEDTVHRLLCNVRDKEVDLSHLSQQCNDLKKLEKVRKIFAKEVGVESWEEAKQRYPVHTTDSQLQQFTKTPMVGKTPHPALLHHCQKALKTLSATDQNSDSNQQVAIVNKEGTDGQTYTAALFGIPGIELVHTTITKALPQFPGFTLAIADTAGTSDDILDDKVSKLLRMVKATNVLSGEVGYAVLLMYSVNQVSSLTKLIERAELSAEVAFWVNANGTKSKDHLLLQAVVPMVLAISSREVVKNKLPSDTCNFFQGSLAEVLSTIVDLMSNKGDWILQFDPDTDVITRTILKRNTIAAGALALDLELKIASSSVEKKQRTVSSINVLFAANKNKRFSSTDLIKPSIKPDCFDKL